MKEMTWKSRLNRLFAHRFALPVLCWCAALVFWLVQGAVAFAGDSSAKAKGTLTETSIPIESWQLAELTWGEPGENSAPQGQLITTGGDPQMILENVDGRVVRTISYTAQFDGEAREMCLYYTTKVGEDYSADRRVFPQSDRAADVLAALRSYAADAKFVHGSAKELLIEDGRCVGVRTSDGKTHRAAHVLVTTGGTSYPATGSDGSGYKLARQAGHTIVPPQPSLCSLVSPDPACRQMMGLSLRNVTLTLLKDGKPLFTEQGEALFTHFGLSGPLVLSASTYIEDITKHRYICEFDLKPALDEKTLYDRLTRDFAEQGSHSAQGALAKLLPNSMRPVAVEKWGIDPATKAAQITREQKQALVDLCKHWQVPVSALGDKEHAVITAGGVDVREVDPKTMASKLCAGLYFAGEVLDVDARTGGYNLQIAWSTAVAAAKAL